MPAKPSWILQLPRMQEELEALTVPVVDRACFEKVFGVRRRRAIQLMHQFGGYQSGRTFLIERVKLLRLLRRIAGGDYEWEVARRTKLVAEIERTKKLLPGRQVQIVVPAEVMDQKISDLPAGVHLRPGELRIEFNGAEELLRKLFELSQAILNDYRSSRQFARRAESCSQLNPCLVSLLHVEFKCRVEIEIESR